MSAQLEVEIKLPVDDPERMDRQVRDAGGTPVKQRVFEDNLVLDYPDGRLRQGRIMLRLRLVDGGGLLTVKREVGDQGEYKVRQEQETRVEDGKALLATLEAAGFVTIYRYQKYRRLYRAARLLITLDELPLGCFLELEGETEEIDSFAGRLGYQRQDYINETYRALHLHRHREAGLQGEPEALLFPADSAP